MRGQRWVLRLLLPPCQLNWCPVESRDIVRESNSAGCPVAQSRNIFCCRSVHDSFGRIADVCCEIISAWLVRGLLAVSSVQSSSLPSTVHNAPPACEETRANKVRGQLPKAGRREIRSSKLLTCSRELRLGIIHRPVSVQKRRMGGWRLMARGDWRSCSVSDMVVALFV